MTKYVTVGFGENSGDTATLLLEAAEKAGYPADVVRVRTGTYGNVYEVPEDIADAAPKPKSSAPSKEEKAQEKADREQFEKDEADRKALAGNPGNFEETLEGGQRVIRAAGKQSEHKPGAKRLAAEKKITDK